MSVKDFIRPKNNIDTNLLAARVERGLYRRLTSRLRKDAVSIKAFIEAAAQDYLKDDKSSK